jgi:hypothetical protein
MRYGQPVVFKARTFFKPWRRLLPLLFLFPAMVSCGGDLNMAGGGISGTGYTALGPITAKGSIFVNGIEFETTGANVTLNGVASNEKDLQVGMVVEVAGMVNSDGKTGKADVVTFNHNIAGPINSIDPDEGILSVVGQTVLVDAKTIIADPSGNMIGLAGLAIGDQVEISGMTDADGNIKATRITRKPTAVQNDIEVRGLIGWVDATNKTLYINGLAVDYGSATLNNFAPSGVPNPWDNVVVKGRLTSPTTVKANLVEKTVSYFDPNFVFTVFGFVGTIYYEGQSVSGCDVYTMYGPMRVEWSKTTAITGRPLKDIKAGCMVLVEGPIQNYILKAKKLLIY